MNDSIFTRIKLWFIHHFSKRGLNSRNPNLKVRKVSDLLK